MQPPTPFSSVQWPLHYCTAFTVFGSFCLFFVLQQCIVILNAKQKEDPMGHGAAIASLSTLMRWGKGSWLQIMRSICCPHSSEYRELIRPQAALAFGCCTELAHSPGEDFLLFCQCLNSSSIFVSVQ